VVGNDDDEAVLYAHEGMLIKAPWFADRCAQFPAEGPRRIELRDEDLSAVGSILEYLCKSFEEYQLASFQSFFRVFNWNCLDAGNVQTQVHQNPRPMDFKRDSWTLIQGISGHKPKRQFQNIY
jgi:hypothetical protein